MIYSAHSKFNHFTVVLPVYNEEWRIKSLVEFFAKYCQNVLVVDNFSTDNTFEICSDIASNVRVVQISNNGTIETPEWFLEVNSLMSTDYMFFASCSEQVTFELLTFFEFVACSALADFVETERTSVTGGFSTDMLYCRPSSLFSFKTRLPTVIRFIKMSALDFAKIFPHDSFKSQFLGSSIYISSLSSNFRILHNRKYPTIQMMKKNREYAFAYAKYKLNFSLFGSLLDSSSRIVLDSARVLRSILLFSCNQVILVEYLLRIYLHISTVYSVIRVKLAK